MSPLRAWLCAHASSSLAKFQHLEVTGFHEPIVFQAETPLRKFVAYIDPEDKFTIEDKLSQVSTQIQQESIVTRPSRTRTCLVADQHVTAAPEHRVVWIPEEAPGEA